MTTQGTPLRALLVGCGSISGAWLNAVRDYGDYEMVGYVDVNLAAAQARQAEFGPATALVGTDLTAALAATSPDVVFNCTIPAAHVDVTLAALEAGAHVLTEKPLADSLHGAQRIVQAAAASGRQVGVTQTRRFDANLRRVQHQLDQLGTLTTINSDFYLAAHFRDFRDHLPHILLLDMAVHTFDTARMLSGADPVAVYCHEWNPPGSWYDRDAAAVAIFEMTGGLVFTYRGSWCSEGMNTTWESDWRIVGTRGSLRWDGATDIRSEVVADDSGFYSKYTPLPAPPAVTLLGHHAGALREFADALRENRPTRLNAADNIRSLAMSLAAIASAEQRQRISVEW